MSWVVMHKLFFIIAVIVLVFIAIIRGGFYWLESSADSCWKHEAAQAFKSYGTHRTRSEIMGAAASTGREVINTNFSHIEIIESDPNGCSLGSNGQTVLKIYFDDKNKLNKIRVYRNYITNDPNYQMELIEERIY